MQNFIHIIEIKQTPEMINSVLKAIKIMGLFTAAEPRLSLGEISRRLDMPKSTTHNFLNTLLSEGFIERVNGDQYALGTAPLSLTQNIRVNVEFRDPAAPLLRKLADSSHESVYLTVKDGDYALYIYAVESPRRLLARTAIGDRMPLHCTSVGKAILAHLPQDEVRNIVDRVGLPRFTVATINDWDSLMQEMEITRRRGYALDQSEVEPGIYCIGAPIFNARGRVFGSCSVSGTDPEIVAARLADLSPQVMNVAEEISRRMGYMPLKTAPLPLHLRG